MAEVTATDKGSAKAEEMSLNDQLEVNISTGFIDMHEGVK